MKAAHFQESTNCYAYYLLFFISGFPALICQIVWQRAMFALYGVNIESVTVIVSVFMLGLGLGSLAGGWLSRQSGVVLLCIRIHRCRIDGICLSTDLACLHPQND